MKYLHIRRGIFMERPNRFLANIYIDGKQETVHVKNTGRCRELLIPGAQVVVEESDSPSRKTRYSLIAVHKGEMLVNMDSQAPNAVAAEALAAGRLRELGNVDRVRREVKFGDSRFDIYYEAGERRGFVEVKGVTLERNGVAAFPDAPTSRGVKHMRELLAAKREGYEAAILFLVQMRGPDCFIPNGDMDSEFARTLLEIEKAGVRVLVYDCLVREDEIVIGEAIRFH